MFGYSLLRPSLHSDYYNDIFDGLNRFDIALEGMHTETGPGVYEAAIRYDEVMRAADKATLFKSSVKEIAYRHGVMASFMAKWNHLLPGCGAHIHQSLWDINADRNLFFHQDRAHSMSEVMRHFIAGQLHCLPILLPMYAPTVNSYKRLVAGAWAPVTATWGVDNRTVAVRVIPGLEQATRLEFRVPGADINPYLAMAAALASGLYGIEHKLPLNQPAVQGNGYSHGDYPHLPNSLLEATQAMAQSKLANDLLGEGFVTHFTNSRFWEWKQFSLHVTDWELKRYFEII
jgi:glutamine synthetase